LQRGPRAGASPARAETRPAVTPTATTPEDDQSGRAVPSAMRLVEPPSQEAETEGSQPAIPAPNRPLRLANRPRPQQMAAANERQKKAAFSNSWPVKLECCAGKPGRAGWSAGRPGCSRNGCAMTAGIAQATGQQSRDHSDGISSRITALTSGVGTPPGRSTTLSREDASAQPATIAPSEDR